MARSALTRPRWIAAHLAVLAVAAVLVVLGLWQLSRWGEERALAARLEERLDLDPVPLAEVLPLDAPDALAYRPVRVEGSYVTEEELLLRSRSFEGRSGYHVVTPLRYAEGRAILVNRGWVPFERDTPPVAEALPPGGRVEVRGFLVPSTPQPTGFGPKDPAEGRLERAFHADVERLDRQVADRLAPMVLHLTAQRPPQGGDLPIPAAPPAADPGQNLGYAVQWFSFAAVLLGGYGVLLWRRRDESGPAPDPVTEPVDDEHPAR